MGAPDAERYRRSSMPPRRNRLERPAWLDGTAPAHASGPGKGWRGGPLPRAHSNRAGGAASAGPAGSAGLGLAVREAARPGRSAERSRGQSAGLPQPCGRGRGRGGLREALKACLIPGKWRLPGSERAAGPAVSPVPSHLAAAGQASFRARDRYQELLRLASVANSLLASSGF